MQSFPMYEENQICFISSLSYYQPTIMATNIDEEDVKSCIAMYATPKPQFRCSEDFVDLLQLIFPGNVQQPTNVETALLTYQTIMNEVQKYVI